MNSLAEIAARLCGWNPADISEPHLVQPESGMLSPRWRRSPRTKVALAGKALAIENAIRVLELSAVPYIQTLPGKLIIEPPPGITTGLTVTFWPTRERLRLAKRPTKRQQDLHAFEQALADQGHRIAGYPFRMPKSRARLRYERFQSRRQQRLMQQLADLEEARNAYDESMAIRRQRVEDFAAGRGTVRRDPQLVQAERRFRFASRRAMRGAAGG